MSEGFRLNAAIKAFSINSLSGRAEAIACATRPFGLPSFLLKVSPLATVSLAQVSPYALLALSPGSTSRQLLDLAFQHVGVPMQVAMNLGSMEVIKRFVEIGLGVAIVPRVTVAEEVRQGRLTALPVAELPARA